MTTISRPTFDSARRHRVVARELRHMAAEHQARAALYRQAADEHTAAADAMETAEKGRRPVKVHEPVNAAATHVPCCSSHGVPMTCERYRRTHFVEVRPCCSVDAELLAEADQ